MGAHLICIQKVGVRSSEGPPLLDFVFNDCKNVVSGKVILT